MLCVERLARIATSSPHGRPLRQRWLRRVYASSWTSWLGRDHDIRPEDAGEWLGTARSDRRERIHALKRSPHDLAPQRSPSPGCPRTAAHRVWSIPPGRHGARIAIDAALARAVFRVPDG